MKKTLVAVAVTTAAFTAVTAQAADIDTYGNIQLVYADDEGADELKDNGSTFGFKGEKELKDGLTGFFKYELEADSDEKTSDVDVNLDQAFVGLKGDFGKVQVGTFDSIYNNAIQDGIDSYEYAGLTGSSTTSEGDTIAYFSPEMNGFEIQASVQVKGDNEAEVTQANPSQEDGSSVTAVVKYTVGDLELAFGYDALDNALNIDHTAGIAASYSLGAANVMAKYEDNSAEGTNIGLGFNAEYSDGLLYGSVQTVDLETGTDYDEYAVGATYNLDYDGDVYVYVEAGQQGTAEDSFTALGALYAF